MKKSDLKDGMIVELNYGEMGIILNNSIRYNVGFDKLNIYDDNLRFEDVTIDRIYEVTNGCCSIKEVLNKENLTLIWERVIDWNKVPSGTKVQVKENKKEGWINKYFSHFRSIIIDEFGNVEEVYFTSSHLRDEFTGAEAAGFGGYKFCRIHPSVEIPKEWYKE